MAYILELIRQRGQLTGLWKHERCAYPEVIPERSHRQLSSSTTSAPGSRMALGYHALCVAASLGITAGRACIPEAHETLVRRRQASNGKSGLDEER